MTRRGWALFAAMALIWGIPYLLIKVAVADLSPVTLVLLRTVIGAVVLLPLAVMRGGDLSQLLRHWRAVLVYTLVEVAVPWLLLSNAERHLTSSLTGLLVAAVPLIGAVLALVTSDDDRLDVRRAAGLLAHHLPHPRRGPGPGGRPPRPPLHGRRRRRLRPDPARAGAGDQAAAGRRPGRGRRSNDGRRRPGPTGRSGARRAQGA